MVNGESVAVVIALAGPIASGKSSVAELVARALRAERVSFGRFVMSTLADEDRRDREALQARGQQLLDELGAQRFVEQGMREAGVTASQAPVVWDGVRHPEVLKALETVYEPIAVRLFFMHPPGAARRGRALTEAGSAERLASWESDETERHGEVLRAAAFAVLTERTPRSAAQELLRLLQTQG